MALIVADRVKETSISTGTSGMILLGASATYQTFNAGVGNSNTTYYCIAHQTANEWEIGIGQYLLASNELMRTTVITGSNGTSAVNFSVGTKDVFVTYPAKRSLYGGSSGSLATDVGLNLLTLTNPSAVTFPRFNADNSVSSLDAATFRTAIGAGTGNGTVTSVTGTSPVASSGGTTPAISLAAAYGDTLNPYASKTANYFLAAPTGVAGVPTFRAVVAADIPTLNQNTTGSAATLTTTRTLWGQNFNGSANVTGALSSVTTLSMSGQLTNTVAIGTAPMVITSTTRVANLNVATAGTADVATASTITTSATASAFKVPFANTTASTTGNYGLLQDDTATFTYNPSTNTLTVGTVSGALSGNASTATTLQTARTINGTSFNGSANITVPVSTTQKSDNVAYQIPFVSSTTAGNQSLYTDSAASLTYNPSTNTLTGTNLNFGAATFSTLSGALTGNATTATSASGLLFSGGLIANTSGQTLPTLTTGMALVISNAASRLANFEAVVKQITSSDSFLNIAETSPGIWDLTEGTGPVSNDFFTVQSSALANLATTLDLPGPWTSTPTGPSGNVYIGASSTFGGTSWAFGLSGPAWGPAGSYSGWSSTNSPYYSSLANWALVTDPATTWSSAPSNGFVFSYLQYPPQSSNSSQYDVWGSISGGWNNSSGNSFSQFSPFSSGSTRVYYLVLMVNGNNIVTVNGALFGTSLTTAYDSWSNTTYVFFKCTDDSSVGSLLSGSTAVSWASFNNYYGHAWYEYT